MMLTTSPAQCAKIGVAATRGQVLWRPAEQLACAGRWLEGLPEAKAAVLREHAALPGGGLRQGEGKSHLRGLLVGDERVHRQREAERTQGRQIRFSFLP